MKKPYTIGVSIIFILFMWISGFIPKSIAEVYGQIYVHLHYPEMNLSVDRVEWNQYYGDYVIYFATEDGKFFSCAIGPRFFPISIGQGINELNDDYHANYQK